MYTLPIAPKSFYDPSLDALKAALEVTNGSTSGQLALITAPPTDIEAAWAEVGAGGDGTLGSNVIGVADITTISVPVIGEAEGTTGEVGYKLQIDATPSMILNTGGGTVTALGIALLVGRDTLVDGSNADVKYIISIDPVQLTDGGVISIPAFEIGISYATVLI